MQTQCPWCGEHFDAEPVRRHDNGDEYRCHVCGERHTRKPNDPDAYAFFPADVERVFYTDAEPLFLE